MNLFSKSHSPVFFIDFPSKRKPSGSIRFGSHFETVRLPLGIQQRDLLRFAHFSELPLEARIAAPSRPNACSGFAQLLLMRERHADDQVIGIVAPEVHFQGGIRVVLKNDAVDHNPCVYPRSIYDMVKRL